MWQATVVIKMEGQGNPQPITRTEEGILTLRVWTEGLMNYIGDSNYTVIEVFYRLLPRPKGDENEENEIPF